MSLSSSEMNRFIKKNQRLLQLLKKTIINMVDRMKGSPRVEWTVPFWFRVQNLIKCYLDDKRYIISVPYLSDEELSASFVFDYQKSLEYRVEGNCIYLGVDLRKGKFIYETAYNKAMSSLFFNAYNELSHIIVSGKYSRDVIVNILDKAGVSEEHRNNFLNILDRDGGQSAWSYATDDNDLFGNFMYGVANSRKVVQAIEDGLNSTLGDKRDVLNKSFEYSKDKQFLPIVMIKVKDDGNGAIYGYTNIDGIKLSNKDSIEFSSEGIMEIKKNGVFFKFKTGDIDFKNTDVYIYI